MPFESQEIVVAEDSPHAGGRLDRCVQELAGGSRSRATGLVDHGCVQVDGAAESDPGRRLNPGERVAVRWEVDRRYSPRPRTQQVHRGFQIVHEDRDVIVVDKAARLLTVPTPKKEPHTLVDRVAEHVRRTDRGRGAFVVHRLDRDVSGLLVFGKTREAADVLQQQFAAGKPERRYLALVAGRMEHDRGTFRSRLVTGRTLTRHSTNNPQAGEEAVTNWKVVRRFEDVTLVAARLETGRRNQIRVHFAEAGHPVLGDPRYEPEKAAHESWPHKRLALHAATLSFEHPATGAALSFESSLPPEMARFVRPGPKPAAEDAVQDEKAPPARRPRTAARNPSRSKPGSKGRRPRRK